jgi:glycosyl transferase family 2
VVISADADLTIVVAPREKYRRAAHVFTALSEADAPPFRLVWVDEARAPRSFRRWIEQRASRPGVVHLTLLHRAGANECRMRGFDASATPFVLFLDNDAFLGDGAVSALLECMRDTNASFVSPLMLDNDGSVHHAGGTTRIVDGADGPHFVEELPLLGTQADVIRRELVRAPAGALEMHGVLVRASSLVAAGGLDTQLLSSMDCGDLGLRLQGIDGSGWFEPRATLTYDSSPPRLSDLSLYLGRWCRSTVEHDITRFAATWGVDVDDPRLDHHRSFLRKRCMRVIRHLRGAVRRTFGQPAATRFEDACASAFDLFSDVRTRA